MIFQFVNDSVPRPPPPKKKNPSNQVVRWRWINQCHIFQTVPLSWWKGEDWPTCPFNPGGKVKLETIPDKNFFWTPLGKSYSCWEAEDQGPLKLFNVEADEVSEYKLYMYTAILPLAEDQGPLKLFNV